ncbi:MAG: citrate synthase [Bacteroidota bacterium]
MDLIEKLTRCIEQSCKVDTELFKKYDVKRGLRNQDHTGVLVGLTNIGDVVGYEMQNGEPVPVEGQLYYRGLEVRDIVKGFQEEKRHGYEETVYLLLAGELPKSSDLSEFKKYISDRRELSMYFKNLILSLQGKDLMNMLARSVLLLYNMDEKAEDKSYFNLVAQSLDLIAKFPLFIAYAYHGMRHSYQGKTLSIRHSVPELSVAENFLYLIKGHGCYTKLDADILDLAMVLHAEHGGGNNSTFTIRVTSSSGTDTYAAVSSAIGSLKGTLHGGANLKVLGMMEHIKENVEDWEDEDEIANYLRKLVNKEVYDQSGKIYGIGHAVYTLSDPRTVLLKQKARELAREKDMMKEFHLYELIEKLASTVINEAKPGRVHKALCANVDFYSGFVYTCIGIPKELFTPLFAMARVTGWCAHRLEELDFKTKRIIRPAYKNVYSRREYKPLHER